MPGMQMVAAGGGILMDYKLKPCPFCGGNACIVEIADCIGHGEYINYTAVQCPKCNSCGPMLDDWDYPNSDREAMAVAAWNERYRGGKQS